MKINAHIATLILAYCTAVAAAPAPAPSADTVPTPYGGGHGPEIVSTALSAQTSQLSTADAYGQSSAATNLPQPIATTTDISHTHQPTSIGNAATGMDDKVHDAGAVNDKKMGAMPQISNLAAFGSKDSDKAGKCGNDKFGVCEIREAIAYAHALHMMSPEIPKSDNKDHAVVPVLTSAHNPPKITAGTSQLSAVTPSAATSIASSAASSNTEKPANTPSPAPYKRRSEDPAAYGQHSSANSSGASSAGTTTTTEAPKGTNAPDATKDAPMISSNAKGTVMEVKDAKATGAPDTNSPQASNKFANVDDKQINKQMPVLPETYKPTDTITLKDCSTKDKAAKGELLSYPLTWSGADSPATKAYVVFQYIDEHNAAFCDLVTSGTPEANADECKQCTLPPAAGSKAPGDAKSSDTGKNVSPTDIPGKYPSKDKTAASDKSIATATTDKVPGAGSTGSPVLSGGSAVTTAGENAQSTPPSYDMPPIKDTPAAASSNGAVSTGVTSAAGVTSGAAPTPTTAPVQPASYGAQRI